MLTLSLFINSKLKKMTGKEKAEKHIEQQKKDNKFIPVLLSETWGDAKTLIYYTTLDHQGEYWLVLIDSKSDLSASEEFGNIAENEISTAIEKQFGPCYDANCECKICENGGDCETETPYPAISYHGCSWGVLD